jgi:hypothetical protein
MSLVSERPVRDAALRAAVSVGNRQRVTPARSCTDQVAPANGAVGKTSRSFDWLPASLLLAAAPRVDRHEREPANTSAEATALDEQRDPLNGWLISTACLCGGAARSHEQAGGGCPPLLSASRP